MKKKSQMVDKEKSERVDANVADWHDMLKWIGKDQQLDGIISNLARELKSSGANVAQLGDEIEKYCMEEDEQSIGWGADLRSVDWNRLAQWYWDGSQSRKASYSHSFTPEFYGNIDDAKPSQTPTTVADAIASLSEDELDDIRDEFFPTAREDLPKDILWQAILDMIIETNTVGQLESPVDVWIDPDGYHTVLVFDPIDKEASMKKKSQRGWITEKGIEPIQSHGMTIQPNTEYFMGASSSPDHIIVTYADDEWIWYMRYPYTKDSRIERDVGEDLIYQGTKTWLAAGYKKYHPELANSLERLLAGGEGDTVDINDFKRIRVTVKSADPDIRSQDLWDVASNYGGVGGIGDNLFIDTDNAGLKKLKEDSHFVVVKVEDTTNKEATMNKKSYDLEGESDESLAEELLLYAETTSELYNQKLIPIIKNIYRKVKKGTYDPELAVKLWMYYIDAAAQMYVKEVADVKGAKWNDLFTKSIRQLAAKEVAEREYEKITNGEYDNMFAKKETKEEPEVKEAAMKKKSYDREHLLRDVRLDKGYRLKLYETGRTSDRGTEYLAYEFFDPKGKVLFSGADFQHSPMDAIDSDETVRGLLGFLTLRPGDTDDEYFKDYTKEQLEFADTDAEELQLYGLEPEEGEEPYLFDDVNEDEEIEKESSLKKQAGDETWVVGLWIDNDQGLYGQIQEMAADAISSADGDKMTAVNQLRDELQALVEEMNPAKDEASMFSDLMNHALGRVDWRSIAEEKIDEILENKDEPKLPNGEHI